jgi:hypothetical protein
MLAAGCDQGDDDSHLHAPPPDGGVCGHVDEASGVVLVTHGTTLVRLFADNFETGYPNEIRVAGASGFVHGIQVTFLDDAGAGIPIAEDCHLNHLEWELDNSGLVEVTQDLGVRWSFNVRRLRPGTTMLRLKLAHATHSHFTTRDIPVVVEPAP